MGTRRFHPDAGLSRPFLAFKGNAFSYILSGDSASNPDAPESRDLHQGYNWLKRRGFKRALEVNVWILTFPPRVPTGTVRRFLFRR
jgi:hypothetical protein